MNAQTPAMPEDLDRRFRDVYEIQDIAHDTGQIASRYMTLVEQGAIGKAKGVFVVCLMLLSGWLVTRDQRHLERKSGFR
jgi:hypothetical protein